MNRSKSIFQFLFELWRSFFVGIVAFILMSPILVSQETSGLLRCSEAYQISEQRDLPAKVALEGMRFDRTEYAEFNAIEWQVRLQSKANVESPLFENFPSADFVLQLPESSKITLHWNKGSHGDADDFRPHADDLSERREITLESFGGRSSDGVMPYFNVAAKSGGLIVAVGWTGDWRARFNWLSDNSIQITAGLKQARFRLPPGEQVRLPSVLVMTYRGTWLDGQNKFRRLMKKHLSPANHEPLELMPVAASVHGMLAFNDTTEANLTSLSRDIAALKLPIDTFWLDAGWNEGGFPGHQGNPNPDSKRFPEGLKPVGDVASSAGLRFLVWFEPERVMRETLLHREHPDWLLSPVGTPEALRYQEKDGFHLLDLSNIEARRWMVETMSRCITNWSVSIYRQDFNLYPSYFWASTNTAEQNGLHEVLYINGLYEVLDELQRRHPKLIIDSCAAGGRRMDFEMMRRSVVLWRSDSCWGDATYPRNVQNMTLGLSPWIPLHGLGAAASDSIALRSGMGACSSFAINYRNPAAVEALRSHLEGYLAARQLFLEDFYPLLDFDEDPSAWVAFQYHSPSQQQGVVQAFRGVAEKESMIRLKLKAVQRDKRYVITNWDKSSTPHIVAGAQLLDEGLMVSCPATNECAVVITYRVE